MNLFSTILKFALFTGAFFLTPFSGLSQGGLLELLPGAEKLIYNEKTGAQRIIGNLSFKYQGNIMYCDSADYFDKSNEVKAYGHVHINKNDTLNLFCDSLYYNGKEKKAKLWGNVRVRDREYKLTTDSMEYDSKRSVGIYRHGGRVESILTKEVLTSRVGYFYPNTKNLFFSGKVVYKSPEMNVTTDTMRYHYLSKKVFFFGPTKINTKDANMHCEKGWYQVETEEGVLQQHASILTGSKTILGDSLYFNPKKKLSIGSGNVFYSDSLEAISFEGNYFRKDDLKKESFLTGKAICSYKMKSDTLFMHADSIFAFQDSLGKNKEVKAFHHVRFFKPDMQGKCDSLQYLLQNDQLQFFNNPIVWAKNIELKGSHMLVQLRDSSIQQITVSDKATAISFVDTIGYYNQIGGKKMFAYFKNNEIVKVDVKGNAQTVYFPEEEKKNDSILEIKRKGMNRVYASDLKVYLDSGEVSGVTYVDQADAVFYPISQINKEEQYIQFFGWNPGLRPRGKLGILKD